MQKRAAWIVQQQRFFSTYLPKLPPRRYVSGESHRYLGKQYQLRVHEADTVGVKMARGQINVGLMYTSKRVSAGVAYDAADDTITRNIHSHQGDNLPLVWRW